MFFIEYGIVIGIKKYIITKDTANANMLGVINIPTMSFKINLLSVLKNKSKNPTKNK